MSAARGAPIPPAVRLADALHSLICETLRRSNNPARGADSEARVIYFGTPQVRELVLARDRLLNSFHFDLAEPVIARAVLAAAMSINSEDAIA